MRTEAQSNLNERDNEWDFSVLGSLIDKKCAQNECNQMLRSSIYHTKGHIIVFYQLMDFHILLIPIFHNNKDVPISRFALFVFGFIQLKWNNNCTWNIIQILNFLCMILCIS